MSMDFLKQGGGGLTEDALPNVGGAQTGGAPRWLGRLEPAWYWVASPSRWGVIAGLLVPFLSKINLHPQGGAGGVDSDGKTAFPQAAVTAAELAGDKVLKHDVLVTLADGRKVPYLQRVKGTNGYVSRWQTPVAGTTDCILDAEGYARWLRSLVDNGTIPPPPEPTLVRLRQSLEQQIEAYVLQGRNSHTARLARLQDDLDVVITALEGMRPERQPAELEEADDLHVPEEPVAPARKGR